MCECPGRYSLFIAQNEVKGTENIKVGNNIDRIQKNICTNLTAILIVFKKYMVKLNGNIDRIQKIYGQT